jgi:hypothetical protein
MNKAMKLMTKVPDKELSDELKKVVKQMDENFQKLFDEITQLHKRSQNAAKFGERALKAAQKLRKEDSWGPIDAERSLDAVEFTGAAFVVLGLLEEGQHVLVAPGAARGPYAPRKGRGTMTGAMKVAVHLVSMPWSSLDLPSIQCLEEALKDCPCGLLLVSHDPRIIPLADRILELEDGRLKDS